MESPKISLVTYTYNDAEYAADLVRQAEMFTVRPDEIVVVDDGSTEPFGMVNPPDNLRVLRFENNRGITCAKGNGLSMASGEYILSMDCDTRITPDWLERNLFYASKRHIGMVGGSGNHWSGEDLVSRYMAHFGDNHDDHGEVDFIPGNAFLLRRDVWEHSGGFLGYAQANCQDHYLCNRLRKMGYSLFSNSRAKSVHLRRVSRTALCKRVWKWCHGPIKRQLMEAAESGKTELVLNYLFAVLVSPMIERANRIAELKEPLFYYIEMLYLAHAALDCLDHLISRGRLASAERDNFLAALGSTVSICPQIGTLLKADMVAMGHDMNSDTLSTQESQWNELFLLANTFRDSGVLNWLEKQGVPVLVREELGVDYDFSSYEEASFAV